MSISHDVTIHCDGITSHYACNEQITAATIKEARTRARGKGWLHSGSLDLCKECRRPDSDDDDWAKRVHGLTDTKVRDLRRRYADGASVESLASDLGLAPSTIHNAATGRTWSHVDGAVADRPSPLRLFTDAEERTIGEEYSAGGTYRSLANRHGCAISTIRDVLKRAGTPSRPNRGSRNGRAKLTKIKSIPCLTCRVQADEFCVTASGRRVLSFFQSHVYRLRAAGVEVPGVT